MRDPKKLANEWIKVADDDLGYAQVGLDETEFFANVCFSAQQAFEKYLKGYLLAHNVKYPRIHSLTKLLSICLKVNPKFSQFKEAAEQLTPYSVAARYPDIGDVEFTKQQAKEAIDFAKMLRDFILSEL